MKRNRAAIHLEKSEFDIEQGKVILYVQHYVGTCSQSQRAFQSMVSAH